MTITLAKARAEGRRHTAGVRDVPELGYSTRTVQWALNLLQQRLARSGAAGG